MSDHVYWEISGPRQYLNIPTISPDKWRAKATFGTYPDIIEVDAWGPTESAAREACAAKMNSVKHRMEIE